MGSGYKKSLKLGAGRGAGSVKPAAEEGEHGGEGMAMRLHLVKAGNCSPVVPGGFLVPSPVRLLSALRA